MIRALLFDLDETLLDRHASIQAFLAQQHARFHANLGHVPLATYRERFLRHDNYGYTAKEIVYQRLVEEFALAVEPAQLVDDFYTNSWQPPLLFTEALALLTQARRDGYALAIITNGAVRSQRPKITHGGIEALVDQVLISEAEGIRKPEAAIFRLAAQRLGVQPEECVMVGDNPEADIWGAYQVGMKTIWRRGALPWPATLAVQPHHTVATINELIGFDWQQL
ncbi:MAG: HAD family hydrolase [Caldilineaceae bacterium]|nr:HAD family hydrolase [Caldilineaceae bacterium]